MTERPGIPPAEHATLRAEVLALSAGLLDDERTRKLRAHLAECASCRELEASLAPSESRDDGRHLPAKLIADWPRESRTLKGFEREMVRRHLERCEECREDLKLLGHPPLLAAEPADPTRAAAAEPRTIAPGTGRRGRDTLLWWLGGWAAVASAAVLVLVLRPAALREPPALPPPAPPIGSATSRTLEGPPKPGVRAIDVPKAIPLRAPRRGPGEAVPSGEAGSDGRIVVVELPAQLFEPGDVKSVTLEVADDSGAVIIRRRESASAFEKRRTLLLDSGEHPWSPGRYVLRLVLEPGPGALVPEPERREYAFEIAAGP